MKIMKYATIGLLFLGITTLVGCKKEDMSKYATKDDLDNGLNDNQAKVYDFSLVFSSVTKKQTYNMPSGSIYNKIALIYFAVGYKEWVLLPYYENAPGYVPVNYIGIVDELLEEITIRTDRGDNQADSPWVNVVTKNFKVVVLDKKGIDKNPNVNIENYKEVAKTFNLD